LIGRILVRGGFRRVGTGRNCAGNADRVQKAEGLWVTSI
jgi:hypothetical protein